jgi:hypothetical protein
MFLRVRIFIFFAKATENKDRTTNLSNICRCFFVLLSISFYTPFAYIFFTNKHFVGAFFLILKSNKREQNPTCLHCIENTELVG